MKNMHFILEDVIIKAENIRSLASVLEDSLAANNRNGHAGAAAILFDECAELHEKLVELSRREVAE